MKGLKTRQSRRRFRKFIILFSVFFIIVVGLFIFYQSEMDISKLNNTLGKSTEIYDVDGKLASKVTANKAEGVSIDEIPDHVIHAVVATEDRRFFEHSGIDYKGILRAFFVNIKAGEVAEGGSTITQQLTKISLLESDRTFKRKFKELFLAREIENEYSKDEILEMYLNQIYYGHGAWGIKKAAEIYFGKEISEISLSEGAVLAGLINRPSKLDPYEYYDDAVQRRNLVLSRMEENGYISSEQEAEAKSEKILLSTSVNTEQDLLKGKYPYYVDAVLAEASNKYDIELDELLTGGYKIYTTLDQNIQQAAEDVYDNDENFPKGVSDDLVQSGTILLHPKTGGISAVIGGRGEHQFMGYNRATQLIASPGSTIKPLVVYTPALEDGFEMTDLLVDEKTNFDGYEPSNANNEYQGEVPMYEALRYSLNVPTVWLLNEVGIKKGLDTLEEFGIPFEKEDRNLSIGLGGMTKGVSPQNMAEAYSAFANDGVRIESHAIIKIEDVNGKQVAVWKSKETKVMDESVADEMTTMLLGVVEYGTGKNAKVEGYEIAGKTGSTQADIETIENAVRDQWFVGYTPSLVCAVWAGYDATDKEHYLTTNSSEGATLIFQKIMSKALENEAPKSFNVASIGPLIEERNEEIEQQEKKKYWRDKGNELKDTLDYWRNKIFHNRDGTGNE